MSADNWAVCPKCKELNKKKLVESYGKISASEYRVLIETGNKDEHTLRKDYEIGIYDGILILWTCKTPKQTINASVSSDFIVMHACRSTLRTRLLIKVIY